jgi:hypothetical protein
VMVRYGEGSRKHVYMSRYTSDHVD